MMGRGAKKRHGFRRPTGKRPYRKLFILSTEGRCTEPQYFNMFNDRNAAIHIECIKKKNKSAPEHVLAEMQKRLNKERLRNQDEAWLLVDKDQWNEDQLQMLHNWSEKDARFGLAVSCPAFEYWLLLHFEEGDNINTSNQCKQKLKKYLPEYEKGKINLSKLESGIQDAITNAKARDDSPAEKWPVTRGTTVYRLVQKLLET